MSNLIAEKISEAELELLRMFWDSEEALPLTEIRGRMNSRKHWEDSTIKTLLRRLCEKGAVCQERKNVYYYSAVITEAEYEEYCTQKLIDRLYQGSAKNLVAALVQEQKLTEEDLTEIRAMFEAGDADA